MFPRLDFLREAEQKRDDFVAASPSRLDPLLVSPKTSLFIWVPKTAGSSIFHWIARQQRMVLIKDGADLWNPNQVFKDAKVVSFSSMNIDSLIEEGLISRETLEARKSFSFVRNPYSRIASLFRYVVKMRAIPKKTPFSFFLRMVARQKATPGAYNWAGLSMASPMASWIRQEQWAGPSRVFKIEDGPECFLRLGKWLELSGVPERKNATSPQEIPVEISDGDKNIIDEIYHEDFLEFDYSRDVPDGLKRRHR